MLDAALSIVARRGAVRMTLAEVGKAAGCAVACRRIASAARPGSCTRSLATSVHASASSANERPALAPGLESIVGNIHFYFSRSRTADKRGGSWTATRALLVMMTESFMEAPSSALRKEIVAYNRKALAWFERHIAAGIERGEIAPDTDAAVTAVVLLGAMRGAMLQWLLDDRIKLLAVRDRLLQITAQVLAPR